jgi:protein-disulfide isomerase
MSRLTPPLGPRDHTQGSPRAAVTLVEYGDFECPHCGAAYPIVKAIQQAMGSKLLFAYRHFPLGRIHPHAEHAAEIAEAAGEHGKFWPMHDLLFEHQDALEDDQLIVYAKMLGIDPAWAAAALADERFQPRVREDFASGVRSGVNGTPTFFINGLRYDGGADTLLDALMEATIDAPLKSGD